MADIANLAPTPQQPTSRRSGPPAKVTREIVCQVAQNRAEGLSLKHSLALLSPPMPCAWWEKAMRQRPYLALLYEQSLAEHLLPILRTIAGSGGKGKPMPVGSCWLLERSMPDIYSTARAAQVNVQVNTVVGLSDDIMRRAASVIKTTTNGGSQPEGKD